MAMTIIFKKYMNNSVRYVLNGEDKCSDMWKATFDFLIIIDHHQSSILSLFFFTMQVTDEMA